MYVQIYRYVYIHIYIYILMCIYIYIQDAVSYRGAVAALGRARRLRS